jgi:hypothetical protein
MANTPLSEAMSASVFRFFVSVVMREILAPYAVDGRAKSALSCMTIERTI